MGIDYIPVLKLKNINILSSTKLIKAYFFLGLVAMILYWHFGNQNIE
jgi:hypothetical protein